MDDKKQLTILSILAINSVCIEPGNSSSKETL
jgi:hypothetical protein